MERGNYLDAVELKSGPPLADIKQGCEEPAPVDVTICGQNNDQQIGCELGGSSPWMLSPTYDQQAATVRKLDERQLLRCPEHQHHACVRLGMAASRASSMTEPITRPTAIPRLR